MKRIDLSGPHRKTISVLVGGVKVAGKRSLLISGEKLTIVDLLGDYNGQVVKITIEPKPAGFFH